MRIGVAQLNPTIGDLHHNCTRILQAAEECAAQGAELLVCPELALCGYPPKDLLLRSGFVSACDRALDQLAEQLPKELGVLIGHPTHRGCPAGQSANAASLLEAGEITHTLHKTLLPNYDVFDERRYFRPASDVSPIEFRGRTLGVHICEDAWYGQPDTFYHERTPCEFDPVESLINQGAEYLINLSASPFEVDKLARRHSLMAKHSQSGNIPSLFVNQVGGNDDLVFDGGSFVLDRSGKLVLQLPQYESVVRTFHWDEGFAEGSEWTSPVRAAQLLEALTLGLRDYAWKTGFRKCVLGLSGGIDSAVASCLAAKALGPENVNVLLMPSRYSSDHSVSDSWELARNLGIQAEEVPIDEVHRAYESTRVVGKDLEDSQKGLADQNLQARIRGAMVMIRSNQHGWLPLATGNKSELAVGYCTLYGDMAGGFAVLCDVLKRDVYAVAEYFNVSAGRDIIPRSILEKPPSAELAPNQFDQDSLPPYDILDGILEGLIEREESVEEVSRIYPQEIVEWTLKKLDRNEFKRRQMPPGIKLTRRAFGSGRRMPMAARYEKYAPQSLSGETP